MIIKWNIKNSIIIILSIIVIILFLTRDNQTVSETKEIIKEKIIKVEVKDTIYTKKISPPIIKYIIKDNDSVKINEYKQKLESNNATANLTIHTTGHLQNVFGTITTEKVTKIVTKEKKIFLRDNKLFLGLEAEKNNINKSVDLNLSADFVVKDKWILGAKYSPFTNSFGLKIGRNIFSKKKRAHNPL